MTRALSVEDRMSVDKRSLRKQNISTVVFSFVLVGCITIVLLLSYNSRERIQDFALDQLRHDTEKRALALSYFYSERRNDLKSLAEQRALSTFSKTRPSECPCSMGSGTAFSSYPGKWKS